MYITLTYKFNGEKYDYEVAITKSIVFEWYKSLVGPSVYDKYFSLDKKVGFERCFDLIWLEDVFTPDYFANNYDFMRWLEEKEKDNALKEYNEQL